VADVIALPTAAADLPPRVQWRGRYPREVTAINSVRQKRRREQDRDRLQKFERHAALARSENVDGRSEAANALLNLYDLAMRREIAGIVLALENSQGEQTALVCAEFVEDHSRAVDAAERLYEVLGSLDR
jgi:hypothetical protein